tara:strand:- start:179 stop:1342 length:1164 start_codon:yes stop_codon:yes gene_type:complete
MKKLILHVGFHKTATSSIQSTLANNRLILNGQGFEYPSFNRHGDEIINHSIPFYSVFCEEPKLYHINIKNGDNNNIEEANNDYSTQIEHSLDTERDVIISGEDISMLSEKKLFALKNYIVGKGYQLKVFCCVRRPYPFTCSELQEQIKSGNGTLENILVPRKSEYVKKLMRVFGDVVQFSNFEDDCKADIGVVATFLRRIGVRSEDIELQNSNEGFGNQATRVLSFLNQHHPNIVNGQINPKGRGIFSKSVDNNKFLLTQTELRAIKEQLDDENESLKELLGEKFCDEKYDSVSSSNISLSLANEIIKEYSKPHTLDTLILYLVKNGNFDLIQFFNTNKFSVETYRNVAISLKSAAPDKAFQFVRQAKLLRPNGPLINEIYDELSNI